MRKSVLCVHMLWLWCKKTKDKPPPISQEIGGINPPELAVLCFIGPPIVVNPCHWQIPIDVYYWVHPFIKCLRSITQKVGQVEGLLNGSGGGELSLYVWYAGVFWLVWIFIFSLKVSSGDMGQERKLWGSHWRYAQWLGENSFSNNIRQFWVVVEARSQAATQDHRACRNIGTSFSGCKLRGNILRLGELPPKKWKLLATNQKSTNGGLI